MQTHVSKTFFSCSVKNTISILDFIARNGLKNSLLFPLFHVQNAQFGTIISFLHTGKVYEKGKGSSCVTMSVHVGRRSL